MTALHPSTVRLIYSPPAEGEIRRGPAVGMAGLVHYLEKFGLPEWLSIAASACDTAIPWYWNAGQARAAARDATAGRPFIIGPNMLWVNRVRPNATRHERTIARAPTCRLIFCHTPEYADCIRRGLGQHNAAEICPVPYPVWPEPPDLGTLPFFPLLIYYKSGPYDDLVTALRDRWPRAVVLRYGTHSRNTLLTLARQSRAAVYLSADDHGPLALAEILLSGCPVIGHRSTAPWIEPDQTGLYIDDLADAAAVVSAVEDLHEWDLNPIRDRARELFDPRLIVETVLAALDRARRHEPGRD